MIFFFNVIFSVTVTCFALR